MNMNFDYHFSVFEYLILSKVRRVASASAYDEDVKFIRSYIIKCERWNAVMQRKNDIDVNAVIENKKVLLPSFYLAW